MRGHKQILLVRMYFGQSMANGQTVPANAWDRFLSETVTPHFPGGFTVYHVRGQWTDVKNQNLARERTKVVEIAIPDGQTVRNNITDAARAYRQTFHQQSAGIATSTSCAAF